MMCFSNIIKSDPSHSIGGKGTGVTFSSIHVSQQVMLKSSVHINSVLEVVHLRAMI